MSVPLIVRRIFTTPFFGEKNPNQQANLLSAGYGEPPVPVTLLDHLTSDAVQHRRFGSVILGDIDKTAKEFTEQRITYESVLERSRSAATVGKYRALTRALILYTSMAYHNLPKDAVEHIRTERAKAKSAQ